MELYLSNDEADELLDFLSRHIKDNWEMHNIITRIKNTKEN